MRPAPTWPRASARYPRGAFFFRLGRRDPWASLAPAARVAQPRLRGQATRGEVRATSSTRRIAVGACRGGTPPRARRRPAAAPVPSGSARRRLAGSARNARSRAGLLVEEGPRPRRRGRRSSSPRSQAEPASPAFPRASGPRPAFPEARPRPRAGRHRPRPPLRAPWPWAASPAVRAARPGSGRGRARARGRDASRLSGRADGGAQIHDAPGRSRRGATSA
jgi:hypothetical protein